MHRRIMNAPSEDTQRQKPPEPYSGRRERQSENSSLFAVKADDTFSVASSRSNVSGSDIVDFMDDFIEKASHLAHNRIKVMRIQVSQALVNTLHHLSNEIFSRETLDRIENWLIFLFERITFAIVKFVARLMLILIYIVIIRETLYYLIKAMIYFVFKEGAPPFLNEIRPLF